jgi:hypothetical protein
MRAAVWIVLLGLVLGGGGAAQAQTSVGADQGAPRPSPVRPDAAASGGDNAEGASAALAHIVERSAILYNRPDSAAPVSRLPVRTPLHRQQCRGGWCRVRTDAGQRGYVSEAAVSSVWIRVSKAQRRVFLYRGPELLEVFEADVGYNTFSDKKRRGSRTLRDHWRTPQGVFYVVKKNPESRFYKALVLNYPTTADARRGLEQGLISKAQYEAIAAAQADFRMPPMDTKLGGWIELHGTGTGAATTWTQGCVAVTNDHMDRLWTMVEKGTPVLIE